MYGSEHTALCVCSRHKPAPLGAKDACSVRLIHNQSRAVALGEREQISQGRTVAFHAEKTFNHDKSAAGGPAALPQGAFEEIEIEMGHHHPARVREADAVNQACMV